MRRAEGLALVVFLATLAASILLAPVGSAKTPTRGAYSGTTRAGDDVSMVVKAKRTGPRLRPRLKWVVSVVHMRAALPVTCATGQSRSEEVAFPGPLRVGLNGRFGVSGVAQSVVVAGRVTTKVAGRFTGRRRVSGTVSYRGGFNGEFCTGSVAWQATRR